MAVCSSCIVLWLSLQAELLTGLPVSSVEDASQVGLDLLKKGCGSVIVTLGPQGCVVCQSLNVVPKLVPSTTVTAVDTTVRLPTPSKFYISTSTLQQSFSCSVPTRLWAVDQLHICTVDKVLLEAQRHFSGLQFHYSQTDEMKKMYLIQNTSKIGNCLCASRNRILIEKR